MRVEAYPATHCHPGARRVGMQRRVMMSHPPSRPSRRCLCSSRRGWITTCWCHPPACSACFDAGGVLTFHPQVHTTDVPRISVSFNIKVTYPSHHPTAEGLPPGHGLRVHIAERHRVDNGPIMVPTKPPP